MKNFKAGNWYLIKQFYERYINIVLCSEDSDNPHIVYTKMRINFKGDGNVVRPYFENLGGRFSDIQSFEQIEQNDPRIQNNLPKGNIYKLVESANLIKAKSLYKAGDEIKYSNNGGKNINDWTLGKNEIYNEHPNGDIIYGHNEVHLYNAHYNYWMENTTKHEEIIGYKLKENCKKYENAVKVILNNSWWDEYAQLNLKVEGWMFASDWRNNSCAVGAILEQAGVLSLWFEPVYKQSEEIVTLSYGGKVKVSKGKIEVGGENITIEGLQNLVDDFGPQEWPGIPWPVTVNETVKIGCWEKVTKQDLELVIKTYKNINS